MPASAIPHPFYPLGLSVPNYTPSQITMIETLAIFFSFVFAAMAVASFLITRKTTDTATRLLFVWWVSCSMIHGIVEGYFAFTNGTIAGDQTVLSAVWKEYAMSDSRYMTSDPFVVVMEGFTAVLWGPLSMIAAYLLYHSHPSRHLLQLIISCGQLYGLLIYYGTEIFEGFAHASPAFLHFYVYFWGFNFPWFVIPLLVIRSSGSVIIKACTDFEGKGKAAGAKKVKKN
ncbi:hypothetical protein HDU79_000237 [Rhizoclosmatium sp. JEL0117]|nr:hypothetical protein HDU79_000237 [Rhizoclosmatium sp. JEL0117]